jgi:hypothetical protein|nr:MAG TPA: hypothetical protein [Bacteriophage sp.]
MTQELKFIETTIPVGEEVIQEVPVEEVTETEVHEVEEVGNQTGIQDKSFEALITDPNFILQDFRGLCEKHGIGFVDLMNDMGFNAATLKALLVNKPITEQIFVLARELSIVIFKMGEDSDPVVNTLDVRTTLGNVGDSKEFLELLDTFIFPYMAEYVKNGNLDPNWILPEDPSKELQQMVSEQISINQEMQNAVKEADVRMGELKELEEAVELTQGETVVAVVSEEELKEALEHATPTGDLEVESTEEVTETESVEEPTKESKVDWDSIHKEPGTFNPVVDQHPGSHTEQ